MWYTVCMPLSTKEIKQRYFDKVYANAKEIDCACGCGTKIKEKDKYGRKKTYVSGHNGRKYSDPNEFKRQYLIRNRDKHNARNRLWKKNNPQSGAAWQALRRAQERKCTPPWADLKAIRAFYLQCPKGMHVDHIIPIINDKVCGLHVLHNLQYLTAEENIRKNNHFEICHTKNYK